MSSDAGPSILQHPAPPWAEQGAAGQRAMLTEILARVSREALQGEGLDAVLQRIVDCLVQRLPVAIASIILLDDAGGTFLKEVWAGELELDQPQLAPSWPVSVGAAGRCARTTRLRPRALAAYRSGQRRAASTHARHGAAAAAVVTWMGRVVSAVPAR